MSARRPRDAVTAPLFDAPASSGPAPLQVAREACGAMLRTPHAAAKREYRAQMVGALITLTRRWNGYASR